MESGKALKVAAGALLAVVGIIDSVGLIFGEGAYRGWTALFGTMFYQLSRADFAPIALLASGLLLLWSTRQSLQLKRG